jgi:hypothetical protein
VTQEEVTERLKVSYRTVRQALTALVYQDDPALDFPITGNDMPIVVVYLQHDHVNFGLMGIQGCNILSHEEFIEHVFEPMKRAIQTERSSVVIN